VLAVPDRVAGAGVGVVEDRRLVNDGVESVAEYSLEHPEGVFVEKVEIVQVADCGVVVEAVERRRREMSKPSGVGSVDRVDAAPQVGDRADSVVRGHGWPEGGEIATGEASHRHPLEAVV